MLKPIACVVLPLSLVFALRAGATEPGQAGGVTPTSILVGQSAALKGPAAGLGVGMQAGLGAYFARVNKAGGVDGRTIELQSLNDSYEPETCAVTTKTLIEKSGVFLLIGGVGTPTSKVAVPICTEAKVPWVGAFTGAELLRSPYNRYVVNVRASYFQETERLSKLLVDERGMKKVAVLYQNDAFGQAGLEGMEKALGRRGMQLVSKGTFERNTVAVATALKDIGAGAPEAIVMVGPYKPVAAFTKMARQDAATKSAALCTISFVGTMDLLKELGTDSEGVIISQVVPFPWDESVPVVKDYQADMKAAGKSEQVGFTSLEGYLVGKLFAQALDQVDGEPTRETFLDVLARAGKFDLGGYTLQFGADDNQGSDAVWLTCFKGGQCVPMQ